MSEIQITKIQSGSIVDASIGDLIIIRLDENLTTGYAWELEKNVSPVLDLIDTTYSEEPGELVGRGGTRTFRFRTNLSGSERVQLKLRRSWEPKEKSIDDFEITIKIT